MPPKKNWMFKKEFDSATTAEQFIISYIVHRVTHNNQYSCTLAECDFDGKHKMRYITLKCVNERCNNECKVEYLLKRCDYSKTYLFYQFNKHNN